MIGKARHDYVELPYLYGGALFLVFFLSAISVPMDTSRLGVLIPFREEKIVLDMYDQKVFSDIEVRARAYVVYDLVDKRVIASKNAEEVLPLASITKVMTALTALTHTPAETVVQITSASASDGYDLGLREDQEWDLGELLKYTLVFSSNDGAYAIAHALGGETDFVAKMNTDSALHGLGLVFTDPAGLDVGADLGGKGTALDVAKLFGIMRKAHPDVFESTTRTRLNVFAQKERITGIPNTNQEIEHLFGAEASKTGFTDSAGGNLGVVVDVTLGHPVVIVVLGSTREERFSDMEKLYFALLESVH